MTYDIAGNTSSGSLLSAFVVALGLSASEASLTGRVRDNTIGNGDGRSCSAFEAGVLVAAHGYGRHVASITNNRLMHCWSHGVLALATHGGGALDLTLTGNRVEVQVDGPSFALEVGAVDGASTPPSEYGVADAHAVCLALGDPSDPARRNQLSAGSSSPDGFRIRQSMSTTLRLPGYTGAAGDGTAARDWASARNYRLGGAAAPGSAVVTNVQGTASCATP